MKQLKCVLFGFLFVSICAQAQPALEKLWQTEGLKVPESVLYYHEGRSSFLLVSQIDGDPSVADGKGGIAQLTLNGDLSNAEWVTGLNAPKGMAFLAGKLYVADITELVIINIKSRTVEKKVAIPGAQFLNDVTIDGQGTVYISDTKNQKIYRYKDSAVDEYIDKIESANGLKVIGGNLIVGAGKTLLFIDKEKHRLPLATGFAQDIDGVEFAERTEFIVSCWPGLIYYVHADGKLSLLLDSQAEKINTADIAYDEEAHNLYVPNFSKNTVTAYRLTTN